MFAGLAFLALSWLGFNKIDSMLPPEPTIIHTLSNGDLLEEKPGEMCPSYAPNEGCRIVSEVDGKKKHTIFYPSGAEGHHARLHEVGHALGGEHGQWEPHGSVACAKITESGRSGWKVGEYECTQYKWAKSEAMSPYERDKRQNKSVAEVR